MQAEQPRPALVAPVGFAEDLEHPVKFLVGTGQRRGNERRGTIARMGLGHAEESLDRPVHEVVPATAVHVHVDESRSNISAPGVDNPVAGFGRHPISGKNPLDTAVAADDGHAGLDPRRADHVSVRQYQTFHIIRCFRFVARASARSCTPSRRRRPGRGSRAREPSSPCACRSARRRSHRPAAESHCRTGP